ncbi:hypothetical protein TanjilG_21658 [Lupinus angustifolius]|uniref:Leucine-rich repeat-containing N-terminal plant-type domain-containing protein n=1 Tax=Lupinus angustifolius TaxID=3871 RepID=A0A1J7HZU3_LUPAN|nr:hypothetical protein TanjilG_21658 [Lupinus angustifolius]
MFGFMQLLSLLWWFSPDAIKSIILRNNSFYGTIPSGIVHLKELKVLDLGYNNFSGTLPTDLEINISLTILMLQAIGIKGKMIAKKNYAEKAQMKKT